MITDSTRKVLRSLNGIVALTLLVFSLTTNLNGELLGLSIGVSFCILLVLTCLGLICVFTLMKARNRGAGLIMLTALYLFFLFTLLYHIHN